MWLNFLTKLLKIKKPEQTQIYYGNVREAVLCGQCFQLLPHFGALLLIFFSQTLYIVYRVRGDPKS